MTRTHNQHSCLKVGAFAFYCLVSFWFSALMDSKSKRKRTPFSWWMNSAEWSRPVTAKTNEAALPEAAGLKALLIICWQRFALFYFWCFTLWWLTDNNKIEIKKRSVLGGRFCRVLEPLWRVRVEACSSRSWCAVVGEPGGAQTLREKLLSLCSAAAFIQGALVATLAGQ